MLQVVYAGGPHSGKSSLTRVLREVYPEAHFIDEPATLVIEEERKRAEADPAYTPIHPAENYRAFAPLVLAKSEELEDQIPPDAKLVHLERSRIDTIAYCQIEGVLDFIPTVRASIERAQYDIVFFCAAVGSYAVNGVRYESPQKARATHRALLKAYEESELPIHHLPAEPNQTKEETLAIRIPIVKDVIDRLLHTDQT